MLVFLATKGKWKEGISSKDHGNISEMISAPGLTAT